MLQIVTGLNILGMLVAMAQQVINPPPGANSATPSAPEPGCHGGFIVLAIGKVLDIQFALNSAVKFFLLISCSPWLAPF
jgi:hypothetical protein